MPALDPNQKIRILIVDDHYFVRVGLAECIHMESDMEVVGHASNGSHAVQEYRRTHPDILLVDLLLPGMDGIEVITAIRRESSEAKAIVLSTYHGDEDIYRAFQSGANGYLLKSMERETLVEAIRTVHSGKNYLPPVVAERLSRRLPRPSLSSRELDVLHLIVRGLSNKEIGSALSITEGTVKLHVHKVLEKLKVADRTQAATAALRSGIFHLE
jgi:two-component system NarL family response regulator